MNDWGNVTTMTQDPDSAVGGGGRASGSLSLYWARNTVSGGWQSMMLTGTSQPGGVDVNPVYGGSTTLSGLLGRPLGVDDGGSVTYAQYDYLGMGTVVGVTLGEPSIYSRAYGSGGSSDYTRAYP